MPPRRRGRPAPARASVPKWAAGDRVADIGWIGENLHIFWPLAQEQYRLNGRGTLCVLTTVQIGPGHPIFYQTQTEVEQVGDEDCLRLIQAYEPERELVITLFKTENKMSSYRIGVLGPVQ
jgi:hypothetical protein